MKRMAPREVALPPLQLLTAVIPAGSSVSNAVDVTGGRVVRITLPAGWTGAPNAVLGLEGSSDGTDFHTIINSDTREVGLKVIPNAMLILPSNFGRVAAWLRFTSGTAEQTEDRILEIAVDPS